MDTDAAHKDPEDAPPGDQTIRESRAGGSQARDVSVSNGEFVGRDKGLDGEDVSKIIEVLLKYLPDSYVKRPEQLDELFSQFQKIHAELSEWKELHNFLDTTIQYYDQFWDALGNSGKKTANLANLRNSWLKISVVLDQQLKWAETITHIGKRYSVGPDGKIMGEDWAIKLELIRREIEANLANYQKATDPAGPFASVRRILGPSSQDDYQMNQLQENASNYRTLVYGYMHWADDRLRDAAGKLVEYSQSILRRS